MNDRPVNSETMMDAAVNVLGSMINYPDCVGLVLSMVETEDFVNVNYQAVFSTIRNLYQERRHIDKVTVAERLKLAGNDLTDFIWQLHILTPTAAAVKEYAEFLKAGAMVFRMQDIGRQLALAKSAEECRTLAARLAQIMIDRPGIRETTFAEAYEEYVDLSLVEERTPAVQWPFEQLNRAVRYRQGHIGVLGAYPGTGKTAFAMQCAVRFARTGAVGYYSFEGSHNELYERHIARTLMTDSRKIQDNQLSEGDCEEYLKLREQLAGPPVTMIDAAGMTAEDVTLHAQARRFSTVIVDYVQNVRGNNRGRRYAPSEYEKVTEASQLFQAFAVRTGTAVLLLSQMARPQKFQRTRKTADGRLEAYSLTPPPTLSALRSSGQLEQDADFVLLMWREDEEQPDSRRVLNVAKNRHGPGGGYMYMDFDGPLQTFSRVEDRQEPPQWGTRKRETGKTASQPDGQGSIFDGNGGGNDGGNGDGDDWTVPF